MESYSNLQSPKEYNASHGYNQTDCAREVKTSPRQIQSFSKTVEESISMLDLESSKSEMDGNLRQEILDEKYDDKQPLVTTEGENNKVAFFI